MMDFKVEYIFLSFCFFFFSMMIINSMPKPPTQALKKKNISYSNSYNKALKRVQYAS